MKWLIFAAADNAPSVDIIKKTLDGYKTSSVVCNFSSVPELLHTYEQDVVSATHAVVLDIHAGLLNNVTHFYSGYLIGKKIPFFFTGNVPENLSLFNSDRVFSFNDAGDLTQAIHDNFSRYVADEKRKIARDTLFEEGVPFTPDFFAFHIAANNERLCRLFAEAGLDVNTRDAAGTPMLSMAARHNRKELLEWLLEEGADIDVISVDRGYTPVMDAVWKSNTDIVRILVEKNANLNTISRDGQPVLVLAVGTGNTEICRMLAEGGADPKIKDSMGMSALEYAELFKNDSLTALLKKYAQ
jgi:hypothetical protein